MTYFCYVQSLNCSVPHMEPLDAADPVEAEMEAVRILIQHARAYAAHVYKDAELLVTINGTVPPPAMAVNP